MYGGSMYGALVFGAGLIVTSLTPVPPAATESNGYGTAQYGQHVLGAGSVVTSQVPVPPTPSTPTQSNGYGTCLYGAHVCGAGCIVTSLVPVPPAPKPEPSPSYGGGGDWLPRRPQRHLAQVHLVQDPASLAGRARSIPRELTPIGEEEMLLWLDAAD
jgi:hypothetical protein